MAIYRFNRMIMLTAIPIIADKRQDVFKVVFWVRNVLRIIDAVTL